MSGGRLSARFLVAALLLGAGVLAYWSWATTSGRGNDTIGATAANVQEPALPDVSRLDPSVQQRLRDRHAAVVNAMASGGASRAATADAFGSYGAMLMAAEHLVEAEAAFRSAEAIAPDDMRWPYYLGHVYRMRQEPSRAIPMFERALALAPYDVPALVWLGDLHLARGDAAAAEPYLEKAVSLQPQSAAAVSRLGQVALARSEHERAIGLLQRALELDPDAAVLHYPLGMAYRGAGQLERAESHLRLAGDSGGIPPADPLMDAVAAALGNAGTYEARGMQALDARDWTAAVEHLRQAAILAPRNAVTRLNLGTALSLAGDTEGARTELQEAVRLDRTLSKAHFALGVLAQDAGRWTAAIQSLTAAVEHEPDFVDAHFALAEALRRTGRAEAALPHYERVLQLNAAASQARFGRAMALVRLGRWIDARRALEDAVRLHPDQPGLPHALARVLAAAPDASARNGARALALVEPLAQQHASPALSETRAMVSAELGRFDEAVEWQQRAIADAAAAGQAALAAQMQENLARYRRRQPCRTPWRDEDPVHAPVRDRS